MTAASFRPDRATAWLSTATLVAAVATAGSLRFSLGLGLEPCTLCWYQRILMYPLVVVLGVATLEKRTAVRRTALPLVIPGLCLAGYHSFLQATTGRCTFGGPCAAVQWRDPVVGLTIPNLSLVAFGLIAVLLVGMWVHVEEE
ncbi:disulfide bond formation protein B [Halorubrum aethiopicum]|uniref:disulfide bond formation protein B n=1 Tax=Halorubrum aethiopicum TaxID=1758255 RepID=UPI00082E6916|nr:disulfide bond formation protein B [Halorubrum aethiopicum]